MQKMQLTILHKLLKSLSLRHKNLLFGRLNIEKPFRKKMNKKRLLIITFGIIALVNKGTVFGMFYFKEDPAIKKLWGKETEKTILEKLKASEILDKFKKLAESDEIFLQDQVYDHIKKVYSLQTIPSKEKSKYQNKLNNIFLKHIKTKLKGNDSYTKARNKFNELVLKKINIKKNTPKDSYATLEKDVKILKKFIEELEQFKSSTLHLALKNTKTPSTKHKKLKQINDELFETIQHLSRLKVRIEKKPIQIRKFFHHIYNIKTIYRNFQKVKNAFETKTNYVALDHQSLKTHFKDQLKLIDKKFEMLKKLEHKIEKSNINLYHEYDIGIEYKHFLKFEAQVKKEISLFLETVEKTLNVTKKYISNIFFNKKQDESQTKKEILELLETEKEYNKLKHQNQEIVNQSSTMNQRELAEKVKLHKNLINNALKKINFKIRKDHTLSRAFFYQLQKPLSNLKKLNLTIEKLEKVK